MKKRKWTRGQCKRTGELWDQSRTTRQRAIRGVYSSIIFAQEWQKSKSQGQGRKESQRKESFRVKEIWKKERRAGEANDDGRGRRKKRKESVHF